MMKRTGASLSDLPVSKDLVPPSPPSGSPSTYTVDNAPSINKGNKNIMQYHQPYNHQRHQRQRQQVVLKTPPRSLVDDVESPSDATTATSNITSSESRVRVVSPMLSPISHSSSIAKQEEQRHRQQDLREPPSPYKQPLETQQLKTRNNHKQSGKTATMASSSESQLSTQSVAHSEPRKKASQAIQASAAATSDDASESDFVDLTELFVLLQRREWEQVKVFLKEHPNSSRQTIHSKNGTSPLLHIVLRHGPPLSVVNLILVNHDEEDAPGTLLTDDPSPTSSSSSSSDAVWKQTDTSGRLPLHAACSCGPDASLDVISRLISADPDALRMRTKDQHGRFPLHLAVVTNALEDVVMELMINYPDAAFLTDSHGMIPIEYAQNSCYGHNRLVVAMEWAPTFLAASQAGANRVARVYETKMVSLREAHTAYEEQLEDRWNQEKMGLIKEQIERNNDLTEEKERNIKLAEALLKMKKSQQDLIQERDEIQAKLDRERFIKRTKSNMRDEQLRRILLGKKQQTNGEQRSKESGGSLTGNNNGEKSADEEKDKQATSDKDDNESAEGGGGHDGLHSELSLPTLLKRVSEGYESSKRRNQLYKNHLDRQREKNRSLNKVLASTEKELRKAQRKSRCDELTLQTAIDRGDALSEMHEVALADLSTSRDEVDRLKRIDSERERKLAHADRRLRIQEKRLSGVQTLIGSLNHTDERLGKKHEDSQIRNHRNSEHSNHNIELDDGVGSIGTTSPSTRRKEADLSAEIEMAAFAALAAPKLDCSTHSIVTMSPSTRCREADLSVELEAATLTMDSETQKKEWEDNRRQGTPINTAGEKSSFEPHVTIPKGPYPTTEKGTNFAIGTPQSYSTRTVTTAATGDYGSTDGCIEMRLVPAPPLPEEVNSSSPKEFDRYSPLRTSKLDFRLESS